MCAWGVRVRFGAFPVFVFMPVVFVVDMKMRVMQRLVFGNDGVAGRPKLQSNKARNCDQGGQNHERVIHAERPAQPPRQGAGCQPAGVGQGELGGE